jgi:tol-pal system-associated acyl-CoA thioesterase
MVERATADPHVHRVRVYYEDTDHTGVVYHPNYLNYFERAREHLIGVDRLVRLLRVEGVGFVIYKVEMRCRRSAVYGDELEVHTTATRANDYQLTFHHKLYRARTRELLVDGHVLLACVDRNGDVAPLPESVLAVLEPG